MRVGILGIQHESNSFVDQPTTLEDFRPDLLLTGDAIVSAMQNAHHEVGGFLQSIAETGATAVPLFFARALPSGIIDAATAAQLIADALHRVTSALSLDGLLISA